ncbi:glycoside hydrolase family 16 protein [Streptomyces sp. NBC_01465]|uniref:glycoside hydrolase family 16 protein n=1 Tax=Streptomyces sp. NBC_01465 TaxID=2903878 RepID=UPI002E3130C5|nr:glycoside hydrolase family 16 protein [Streptomyces sp. NBC_01465]
MRRRTFTTALLSTALAGAAGTAPAHAASLVDPATPAGAQPLAGPAGTLVFSDEFTGSALDTAKWNVRDQERTETDRTDGIRWWYKPANVRVLPTNGGNLAIDLRKLADGQYAGGRVDTDTIFDYTHGTIEVNVHVPPTQGHLGAVWLQTHSFGSTLGTAADGAEIDLLESAYADGRYAITIHYDGYGADHKQSAQVVSAPGLHSTYRHTIGLNWTASKMEFTYDGTVVRTVTDPTLISQVAEYPILSHEVLQWAQGDVTQAPLDYNSTMYVDYIRVWQ